MIAKTIRTCFRSLRLPFPTRPRRSTSSTSSPYPTGDTGTNMSLTLASVTKELSALPADADMEAIAGAITHGSLMGARGNSGVITSQILRGVAEGLVSADEPITSANIAYAFRRAVKVAFQAVRKPIEGTILTVLRDVSTKADECEKKKFSAEDALDAIVVEAYQSVARTPDLLPVLKENGVVDSGAFGFAIFLENFVAAALGRSTVVEDFSATFDSAGSARDAALGRVEIEANDDWEGSEFRYCNEFLFKADAPFDEDECLKFLGSMGDCELLVGAYPDYKIHVHSNTPNLVLEHMLQLGQIYEVFIHNMEMEAHDRTAKIHEDQEKAAEPAKSLGFGRRCRRLRRGRYPQVSRCRCDRVGWPDHEPLDRRPAGCRGPGQRDLGHHPAQQRQHPHGCRGRGFRLHRQEGCRRSHQDRPAGVLRAVRGPARFRA